MPQLDWNLTMSICNLCNANNNSSAMWVSNERSMRKIVSIGLPCDEHFPCLEHKGPTTVCCTWQSHFSPQQKESKKLSLYQEQRVNRSRVRKWATCVTLYANNATQAQLYIICASVLIKRALCVCYFAANTRACSWFSRRYPQTYAALSARTKHKYVCTLLEAHVLCASWPMRCVYCSV